MTKKKNQKYMLYAGIGLACLLLVGGILWFANQKHEISESGAIPTTSIPYSSSGHSNSGNEAETATQVDVAASCTLSGYEYCSVEEWTETYGCAYAHSKAKLGYNPPNKASILKGGYIVGAAKVSYKCTGDEVTYQIGVSNWGNCGKSGCDGNGAPLSGEITIVNAPAEKVPSIYVYCHDYDRDDCYDGSWAWCWSWTGWQTNEWNIKVVKCYENADCPSGQICDKSGTWNQWACKTDPCAGITCPNKCEGNILKTGGACQNGVCGYINSQNCWRCENAQCLSDPCTATACPDTCQNNVRRFGATCDSSSGAVQCLNYKEENCQFGCFDTKSCYPNPCLGVSVANKCENNISYQTGTCTPGQGTQYTVTYATQTTCKYGCNMTSADCIPPPKTNWLLVGCIGIAVVVSGVLIGFRKKIFK